jgi:3-oxoacyl-[acyl-carrier protein] reductase
MLGPEGMVGNVADLQGKVAVVTGAAQGIGAATARRLAADGASVAVVDLTEERAKETAEAIRTGGGTALQIGCDVSSAADADACVERVVAELGRIDILVNNAGVTKDNLLFKMSEEEWDAVLGVNLKSVFLMSRAAQRHMVPARYGKIVNLSSTSALGNRGQANYSAAKAGVQGLTATLAAELGPFGINVNAVAPGYVATAMTAATAQRLGVSPEEAQELASAQIPLRRVAQPEDIASVIAFLVGDDAGYVTGQTLYVNGGMR